ncbi:SusC/RagA family TonB-linked outer membrane protein [Mucilaginibacter boryungensis]|uniref:SusC/RagA family TonB-linked outer membrane protein n=1 Tax=Mucilaginibacter boryungensis TaxID=768480 RepID=A0ABR9XDP6_9SPHI|nr:SusC/RagA family TonB-linked outer membrane protein [Mucilaginibacter boryungensis]MBE9665513.1 SusC/RagA family TonB-linked outer membrane protein [Mucilaginibacter boryungensis]
MQKLQLINLWKFFLVTVSVNLISLTLFAQTVTLHGKVVDEKGEPLIGATVKIAGTTTAATANIRGEFALTVPASTSKVTVSFIGYTDFVKTLTKGVTNLGTITLVSSTSNLNEVVVVGYGTLKREDVTGTVATVDAKVLKEIPASNVFDQLKGRVAGLDVVTGTNGPVITIRGNRSIGAAPGVDGPLIVLDGQPFYNSIENIDPNNIKSVDVLKGASATAIYGSRASGGVILITTNRGRVGQTITSYDSYYAVNKIEGDLKMLNGTQFAQLITDATQGALLQNNQTVNNYFLTTIEKQALAEGVSSDYPALLLQNAFTWDQNLRVTGGTERTQFNVGAGFRTNNTVERNNNYTRRMALNVALDHKINNYIKFGLSTQTTLRLINSGGAGQLQQARYISPLTYPYAPDGSINPTPQSDQIDGTFVNPLLPGSKPDQYYNYTRGFVSNNILYGEITPVNHLKYRYTVNYNYSQSLQGTYNGINGADLTTIAKTNASTTNNYSYRLNQEHLLTYDNVFARKHSVNFVAGFTNELAHTENSNISATGIPEDANKNSNLGLAQTVSNVGGSFSEQGLVSYVGRLNYAFDHKYDLTATIRSDANSALAEGHQRTTYPSVGLGWVISNERFMKKYDFIDNLKLRGGYGETSTITTISPYTTLGQLNAVKYQFGSVSAGDAQGVLVSTLVNPTLTWQRSAEYNLALDFAVFRSRLTGSVEVYKTRTTGLILPNILPVTTGARSQITNLGTSEDRGLEISLSSINLQNARGINWSTDFNIAFSREKVVYLPNGGLSNINSGEFVGQPLNVIYDVKKLGIWQTSEATQAAVYGQKPGSIKVEDFNNDGKINSDDDQIIGHFNPNYSFGLSNRVSYKNFDLSLVIQGRMGFTTVVPYVSSSNSSTNGWQYLNQGRHNQPVLDYWTPTNPTNAFPEPNSYAPVPYYSTLQYYDGSFIRAKSINLGYNLPGNLLKKIGMSSLRIYANVTNPFFIYAPIRKQSFSVPDAESGYNYNTNGGASTNPADPSASGNIGGTNSGTGGTNFRGVGINASEQTRDFIIGINARF